MILFIMLNFHCKNRVMSLNWISLWLLFSRKLRGIRRSLGLALRYVLSLRFISSTSEVISGQNRISRAVLVHFVTAIWPVHMRSSKFCVCSFGIKILLPLTISSLAALSSLQNFQNSLTAGQMSCCPELRF